MAGDKQRPLLRQLPQGYRFLKDGTTQTMGQVVWDKNSQGVPRQMSRAEILVMALNELAAQNGHGYFLHLRGHDAWKVKPRRGIIIPESRQRSRPGCSYPNIVYMRYAWSDVAKAAFEKESQRSRYLHADGLLNAPLDDTPLLAMQCATNKRYLLYDMPRSSLTVLAAADMIYVLDKRSAYDVIGAWPDYKPRAGGVDAHKRLDTVAFLWDGDDDDRREELQQYSVASVQELYRTVVLRAKDMAMHPLRGRELLSLLPAAQNPEAGVALGTPLNTEGKFEPAGKASKLASRKRTREGSDAAQ